MQSDRKVTQKKRIVHYKGEEITVFGPGSRGS